MSNYSTCPPSHRHVQPEHPRVWRKLVPVHQGACWSHWHSHGTCACSGWKTVVLGLLRYNCAGTVTWYFYCHSKILGWVHLRSPGTNHLNQAYSLIVKAPILRQINVGSDRINTPARMLSWQSKSLVFHFRSFPLFLKPIKIEPVTEL